MVRGLLFVVVVGCAGVAAAPAPAPPVAVVEVPLGTPLAVPGETMVYAITLRGLAVARVQVAVGQPGWFERHPAIIVKSHGETDGLVALIGELDWTLETTIDLERGTPLLTVEDAIITFRGKKEANHERNESSTHTIHSAVIALRGWRASPGQHGTIGMQIADAHIELDVHEAGREFLDKPAVRYEGIARGKYPFKIWLSDDTARVPLRMQTATKWGEVAIELVEYTAPRD